MRLSYWRDVDKPQVLDSVILTSELPSIGTIDFIEEDLTDEFRGFCCRLSSFC